MPIISSSWSAPGPTCCAPSASTSAPPSEAGEGVYAVAEVNIRYLPTGQARRRSARCQSTVEQVRARQRRHSSASHAGAGNIGRCARHRRLPRPQTTGPSASRRDWVEKIQIDQARDIMPDVASHRRPDEPAEPVPAGRRGRQNRHDRPAAGQHLDLGDHLHPFDPPQADQPPDRQVRARFLGGQRHRRLPHQPASETGCRSRRSCRRRWTNGAARPRPPRSTAPAPASGSPAG